MRSTGRERDAATHTTSPQEGQAGRKGRQRTSVKTAANDERTAGGRRAADLKQAEVELESRIVEGTTDLSQAIEDLTRELAERKRTEEALRESEERLRTVVTHAPVVLFALDREGVLTLSEGEGLNALGLKRGEHVGLSVFDLYRDSPDMIEGAHRVLSGQAVSTTLDVAGVPFDVRCTPLRDQNGEVSGAIGVATDVTERKRAEEMLRIQRDLALALNAAEDLDETLRLCLDAAIRVSGMDCGAAYLVDPSSGGLELACHQGLSADVIQHVLRYDPRSTNAQQVMAGQAVYAHANDLGVSLPKSVHDEGIRAIAVVPVRHHEQVVACLALGSHSAHEVSTRTRDALETVAAQVGSAVARSRSQEELREAQGRLRTVVSNMPVILTAIDREGVVTLSEGKGLHALGVKPGEHVGLSVFDVHPGASAIAEHVRRALAGEPVATTVEVAGAAIEGHIEPIRDEDGRVSGAIAVATDITDRVLAEERLRTVVTNAPVILLVLNREGVVTLAEGAGLGPIGQRPEDIVGRSLPAMFPHLPEVADTVRRALAGESGTTTVVGTRLAFETHYAPVQNADGQVTGAVGVAVDVTDRRRAEEALRHSEERMRLFAENAQDIIYRCRLEPDTSFEYVSPAVTSITGYSPEEHYADASLPFQIVHSDDRQLLRDVVQGRETDTVILRWVRKDGDISWTEHRTVPVRDPAGNLIAIEGIARDISERKRAEEALRQSEERLRTVIANAPVILFATDGEGVVTLNEGQGLGTMGVKPGEHIGRSMFDLYRTLPEFTEDLRRGLAGEALTTMVEGAGLAYDAHLAPLRDDAGQVSGLIGVATDVTDHKRTEEALRESEERLRTVVTSAPVILFATDREGVVTLSEGKGLRALGLNSGEAVGQSVFDRYRDVPHVTHYVRRALDGEAFTASGEVGKVTFEAHLAPLRDEQGQVSGVIGVATDVTERRRAEEALRLRDEAMASSVSAIAFADADRRVIYANDSCLRAWGYDDLREILGRPITGFWQLEKRARGILKTLRTRGSWVGELPAKGKDGSVFDALVSMTQARDAAGTPIGMMASFVDITERKRAEEELRRISELKSEFVALVSHELRAPLTNLSGGLELLAQDLSSLPTRDRRAVALLSREYVRLSTLVESILDMSRLDAGQLSLTFGPVWLEPVIAGVAVSVSGAGLRHPIEVDIPRGLPPAWADETHLEQVLRNLVRNAGRYSAPGRPIVVEARAEGDRLMVSVTDRGAGVSREEQEHIFDAFYRGASGAQSPSGYGLGLYFARKLIEAQGGAIKVESPAFDDPAAPGATFTVTLPVAHDEV